MTLFWYPASSGVEVLHCCVCCSDTALQASSLGYVAELVTQTKVVLQFRDADSAAAAALEDFGLEELGGTGRESDESEKYVFWGIQVASFGRYFMLVSIDLQSSASQKEGSWFTGFIVLRSSRIDWVVVECQIDSTIPRL